MGYCESSRWVIMFLLGRIGTKSGLRLGNYRNLPYRRATLDRFLLSLGALCILGAITAGAVEIAGNKLPVVSSIPRQLLLFVAGLVFIVGSLFFRTDKPKAEEEADKQVLQEVASSVFRDSDRASMIERVRRNWIEGYLQESLAATVRIELSMERQPKSVTRPERVITHLEDGTSQPVPADVRIGTVFDEMGQALLIMGAAGAGKTTLMLELCDDLLVRAEKEPNHPIPVVFNLQSWAIHKSSLTEWLMEELVGSYQVPRKLAQAWVNSQQILPLLDGLDEVPVAHQVRCVKAINDFRSKFGFLPMVVCSRSAD